MHFIHFCLFCDAFFAVAGLKFRRFDQSAPVDVSVYHLGSFVGESVVSLIKRVDSHYST